MQGYNKTNRHLLILASLDVLLILFGLSLLLDFRNNRLVEIERLNRQLVSVENMRKESGIIDRTVRENKQLIDRLNLYFVTKATVANFIEELESLASRSDVSLKLDSLDIGREVGPQGENSYLEFKLNTGGDFSNIFRFLTVLESLPYKLRFNTLSITRGKTEGVDESKINNRSPWRGEISFDVISYIEK